MISYANNKGENHKWGAKKYTFPANCWLLNTVNWAHYYPTDDINPGHSSFHLISSIWEILLRLFAPMLAWPCDTGVKDGHYWIQSFYCSNSITSLLFLESCCKYIFRWNVSKTKSFWNTIFIFEKQCLDCCSTSSNCSDIVHRLWIYSKPALEV